VHDLDRLAGLLRERFPRHRHVYFGLSGSTLLYDALRRENRSSLVLPAFLCPSISAMALAAGKLVTHIDSNRESLHIDAARLEEFMATQRESDTAVLIDHSFGYRSGALARLRERFPGLLVIEDCARALGLDAGEHSDWILLSMYKTIRGAQNGGVLLSRTPLALEMTKRAQTPVRERAAGISLFRTSYDFISRFRPIPQPPAPSSIAAWIPHHGMPGELCVANFTAEIAEWDLRRRARAEIAAEIQNAIPQCAGLEMLDPVESAAHFVTLRISRGRDPFVARLWRRGIFLSRTWERLPGDFAAFHETFPFGNEIAAEWSRMVAHIPVSHFWSTGSRAKLIESIRFISC
jgi:dTDP-4-amino-4,6-dideoxygalactose transaminase